MSILSADAKHHSDAFHAVVEGRHADPFSILGVQNVGSRRVVRTLQPHARSVSIIDAVGNPIAKLEQVHPGGLFAAEMPSQVDHYRLKIQLPDGQSYVIDDAYRFPSTLGALDLHLLGEGTDQRIYEKLGAHVASVDQVDGTRFAVWAPNASRVSVIGSFNDWDGRRHVMRLHPANGIWEIFVPHVGNGDSYKFELLDSDGHLLPLRSDPFGRAQELPPGNASLVCQSDYAWRDEPWMSDRHRHLALHTPVSIYEVHLGSWRKNLEQNRSLSYRELADELVAYVSEMGFTAVELMPVSEHPFDGSWGYQPIGLFAPTSRFGKPDDFKYFVDRCHQANIAVILDWVPAHFPKDSHGLRRFDGTALYEHEDPRKGEHSDWGTLIFNYGRREVVNYLIGSALYWIEHFHIDGLRVDAVASMLYLDYSRDDGEWIPNEHGGNENLEAVAFLRELNRQIHAAGAVSFAEESTAWPGVSRPIESDGLGFTFKWNMGWMNDTLAYMSEDPVHRKYHHDKMTFGLVYAFDENFVLPLSHDEVVHGKRSLLGRMPGDEWQRFANLRAYYGAMFAHPGKKLLFMGAEIAQGSEWAYESSLQWHLLDEPLHVGVQHLVRDLNQIYATTPALFEQDFEHAGFQWLCWNDGDNSVLSWVRRDRNGGHVVCVSNFTPVCRLEYAIGVPSETPYVEVLNTDERRYGGSGVSSSPRDTQPHPLHDQAHRLTLTLPPLATVILKPSRTNP